MNEIKLKPCPFCGGEKFVFTDKTIFYDMEKNFGGAPMDITCEACNLVMWDHSRNIHSYEERTKLLAKKWNRRTKK